MAAVMPKGIRWIRSTVVAFEPERNRVVLEEGSRIAYRTLVAAPGSSCIGRASTGCRRR